LVKHLEDFSELVTEYSSTMVLWCDRDFSKTRNYLYLTGVTAEYTDQYNRPILHTMVWRGDTSEEDDVHLRNIMLEFISGRLEPEVRSMIRPDKKVGFTFDSGLSKVSQGIHQCDFESDPISDSRVFKTRRAVIQYLKKYRLPRIPSLFSISIKGGVTMAFGKGLNLGRLKGHKYIQIVFDPHTGSLEQT